MNDFHGGDGDRGARRVRRRADAGREYAILVSMEWIGPLMEWYARGHRDLPWRRTRDAYAVLVSEIMLQQTRVAAVIPYYERFLRELPDLASLAHVEEERLMKLWEGLGYYSRARNLRRAAQACMERYGGSLPADGDALLGLPGIGPYTAGAVGSIAFGLPLPAVDGNVLRVMARLHADRRAEGDPDRVREVQSELARAIPREDPGTFNQAMMELGACVCVPGEPDCGRCPIAAWCAAREEGAQGEIPVPRRRAPRRIEEKTVFALYFDGAPAILRRTGTPLRGLWQLPERPGILPPEQAAAVLTGLGIRPSGPILEYRRKHIFTHVEWRMRVYAADVSGNVPEGMRIALPEDALPTAWRICLRGT